MVRSMRGSQPAGVMALRRASAPPVSFMVGIRGKSFTRAELAAAGVKRISLATSLYRAAMKAAREAATEVRSTGSFGYIDRL